MDVLIHAVRLDQLLITGHMCQNAQLDLGIIRVHKFIAVLRHKHLPDAPAQLHPHRDILKIRLRRADPPRRRDRLVKARVNPLIRADICRQSVRVGGFQLRQRPVLENILHDRIVPRELFKDIRRSGIAGLRLLPAGDVHRLKQHLTELLRGIEVEGVPRHRLNRRGIFLRHGVELYAVGAQPLRVNTEADGFHLGENRQERQFYVRQQHFCAVLTYCFVKLTFQLRQKVRERRVGLHHFSQQVCGELLRRFGTEGGVCHIGIQGNVKQACTNLNACIMQGMPQLFAVIAKDLVGACEKRSQIGGSTAEHPMRGTVGEITSGFSALESKLSVFRECFFERDLTVGDGGVRGGGCVTLSRREMQPVDDAVQLQVGEQSVEAVALHPVISDVSERQGQGRFPQDTGEGKGQIGVIAAVFEFFAYAVRNLLIVNVCIDAVD